MDHPVEYFNLRSSVQLDHLYNFTILHSIAGAPQKDGMECEGDGADEPQREEHVGGADQLIEDNNNGNGGEEAVSYPLPLMSQVFVTSCYQL